MTDDLLDRIDAAVNQRCACGCGADLDPDGPSAWFADQDCQRRWQHAQAIDADDVLQRPDPDLAAVRDAAQSLGRQLAAATEPTRRAAESIAALFAQVNAPIPIPNVLAVVWCPDCRRGSDLTGGPDQYPCCRRPLPELTGTVHRGEYSDGWWLTIESPGVGETRTFLSVEWATDLDRHERHHKLRRLWLRLQHDLLDAGRVPYELLTADERDRLHAWVALHGVNHQLVPIDAVIDYDEAFGEWRIERHALRDGRPYIDRNDPDRPATIIIRRQSKAALPWPTGRRHLE